MKAFVFALLCIVYLSACYQMLQDIPVTFGITGNISYTPSSGGASIPGYKIKIGFNKYSWIGIKFMKLTSRSIYDILIVKRDSNPVGGYYKTTVGDYYVTSGRQDKLLADTINNMDKQVQTYTNNNYFEIELYRTKSSTQGEDWEGGQFLPICFVTSANAFNQSVWSGLSESCYGYDINSDYVSTFRGKQLGSMMFDGVDSPVYGGIEGPVLQMRLFWYCLKPTLSSSDIYFRLGPLISDQLGYDYYKCNSGDYFGASTADLTPDVLWSGFDDGQCIVSRSTISNKISLSRQIYTQDQLDSTLYNSTQVCVNVGGSNEVCQTFQFPLLFPVMDVDSALVIWESRVIFGIVAVFALGFLFIF